MTMEDMKRDHYEEYGPDFLKECKKILKNNKQDLNDFEIFENKCSHDIVYGLENYDLINNGFDNRDMMMECLNDLGYSEINPNKKSWQIWK